jgi:hypothetical protein
MFNGIRDACLCGIMHYPKSRALEQEIGRITEENERLRELAPLSWNRPLKETRDEIIKLTKEIERLKAECSYSESQYEDIALRLTYESLLSQVSEMELEFEREAHADFRREWAERLGFLQAKYPADSIESIDAVATLWNERQEELADLKRRFEEGLMYQGKNHTGGIRMSKRIVYIARDTEENGAYLWGYNSKPIRRESGDYKSSTDDAVIELYHEEWFGDILPGECRRVAIEVGNPE